MASTYPTTLDAFATTRANTDVTDTTHPADHNNANDAINKIEAELGTLPKGSFASVKARLDARLTVRKASDESFTTQVLANVASMSFSVAASQDYYFKFFVPITLGAARGVGLALTGPASPTGVYYRVAITNVAAATSEQLGFGTAFGTLFSTAASTGTTALILIEGSLANGANAGTLQLQLRQGTGATAVNVVAKKSAYAELYLN